MRSRPDGAISVSEPAQIVRNGPGNLFGRWLAAEMSAEIGQASGFRLEFGDSL
jgi:hypothetical protein